MSDSPLSGQLFADRYQIGDAVGSGGGVMVEVPRGRMYVESRYMQGRKGAGYGAMVPITVGLRFPR